MIALYVVTIIIEKNNEKHGLNPKSNLSAAEVTKNEDLSPNTPRCCFL
jgi:hypothetical protein